MKYTRRVSHLRLTVIGVRSGKKSSTMSVQRRPCIFTASSSIWSSWGDHLLWVMLGFTHSCHRLEHSSDHALAFVLSFFISGRKDLRSGCLDLTTREILAQLHLTSALWSVYRVVVRRFTMGRVPCKRKGVTNFAPCDRNPLRRRESSSSVHRPLA